MTDADVLPPLRTRVRRQAALWFGLLGGAAAWVLHLNLTYLIVPHTCRWGQAPWMHLLTLAALAMAVAATVAGRRVWASGHGHDHRRFLGLAGAALSALFVLVIAFEGTQVLLIDPCLGVGGR